VAEVSIAIPTYNGALYLEPCLRSAVNQTFTDTEIVVVDDCSTDRTWAVVEAFSRGDKRIRMYRNPSRLGLVRNWNRCIQYCSGKWIKFLFQDDLLDETCVQKMLDAAKAEKGEVPSPFVVCERRFIVERGVADILKDFYENQVIPLNKIFPGKARITAREFSQAVLEKGVGENFIGEPSSVMIRRDLFFDYSCFNPNLVHLCDLEYWTRIGTHEGMALIPEPLNRFRVHCESASAHNHASRGVELACVDRLVLLHDYLFHPVYANMRQAPGAQAILHDQLRHHMNHLAGLLAGPPQGSTAHVSLFRNVLGRYPILNLYLPDDNQEPVSMGGFRLHPVLA
jgi:glycosyltransferase involved in cell wall biosynthesis